MSGFIQINRSLWSNVDFDDSEMSQREAFVWMIAHAAWRPTTAKAGKVRVDLDRGQLAFSVRFLAEKFGWSKSRVHRFLEALKNRDTIGTESGTGVCVITICNYDKYQLVPNKSGTPSEREAGQQRDSSGTKKNTLNTNNTINTDTDVSVRDQLENEIDIAFDGFCAMARKCGWTVPRDLTKPRKAALQKRLKENTLTGWGQILRKAGGSELIANSAWFSIDWLLKPANLTKVKEGNYDNRGSNSGAAHVASSVQSRNNPRRSTGFASFADRLEAAETGTVFSERQDFGAGEGVIIDTELSRATG